MLVSVAMPIARWRAETTPALESILDQSHAELDVMLLPNGSDQATREACEDQARRDPRVRVIERSNRGLPSALNEALRCARSDYVARMDDDDLSCTTRIERQLQAMCARPSLVVLGSAYERMNQAGETLSVVRLPTEPGEVRWRLLLENQFAHGSVMLRRDAVLRSGGYNESLDRGQDYDLWMRLARHHEIGNVPEVLYRYRVAADRDPRDTQMHSAAHTMLSAWRDLDLTGSDDWTRLIAGVLESPARAAELRDEVSQMLSEREPSRAGLLTWLWCNWAAGAGLRRANEAGKRALLRELRCTLADVGVTAVWLWGAGAHTRWLLQSQDELGLDIVGIVDDYRRGEQINGILIRDPGEIPTGAHVILSSDADEDALWNASSGVRQRGVYVHRMYERDVATEVSA